MKPLLIIIIFIPSFVFGGVGDVYYCASKILIQIKNFKATEYQPQDFKFKRLENSIKFGSDPGYFKDLILTKKGYGDGELFNYFSDFGHLLYDDGTFNFSMSTYEQTTVISGTCSIF